jgi:murein DD-endopeptidase MepM/ murein hydrolase activator NlpD
VRTTEPTTAFTLPRKALATAVACCALLALGTGTALAQTGGVGGGGGTEPPPPGEPTEPTTPPPPTGNKQFFPVKGKHTYGDGFGAARSGHSHQGVDIFAACGTPAVSVMKGVVVASSFQSSAGNYVVIRNKKINRDYAYMHLRKPGLPKGTKVAGRQWVGGVGETGNASGCHLHFEIWKGKWYRGGHPIDPMKSLLAWDAYS